MSELRLTTAEACFEVSIDEGGNAAFQNVETDDVIFSLSQRQWILLDQFLRLEFPILGATP